MRAWTAAQALPRQSPDHLGIALFFRPGPHPFSCEIALQAAPTCHLHRARTNSVLAHEGSHGWTGSAGTESETHGAHYGMDAPRRTAAAPSPSPRRRHPHLLPGRQDPPVQGTAGMYMMGCHAHYHQSAEHWSTLPRIGSRSRSRSGSARGYIRQCAPPGGHSQRQGSASRTCLGPCATLQHLPHCAAQAAGLGTDGSSCPGAQAAEIKRFKKNT